MQGGKDEVPDLEREVLEGSQWDAKIGQYGSSSDIDLIDIQQMIQSVEKRQNEILSILSELGKSVKSDQNANTAEVFDITLWCFV